MKRTQIKDSLRNIRRQIVSFLSVIVITVMGVTTFLGIDFTASSLRKNGSDIYNRLNYRDIEIVSTLLFSEDDLAFLREVEGVTDVEPLRVTEAKLAVGDTRCNVTAISLTQRINQVETIKGRMPAYADECALEERTAEELGVKLGDTVALQDVEGGTARYLHQSVLTVTGVFNHPDHINTIVSDLPYVLVPWDAFDEEELNGAFMKAEVVIEKEEGVNRFSDEYAAAAAAVMKRIDDLSAACTARRDQEVQRQFDSSTAEGRMQLEKALAQLQDARRTLDEKQEELAKGEAEIADAEARLADGDIQLKSAFRQLESGRVQLEEGQKQLEAERVKLNAGKAELDAAQKKLADGKKELEQGFLQLEEAKDTIRTMVRSAWEKAFQKDGLDELILWPSPRQPDVDDHGETARYLWITENLRFDLSRPLSETFRLLINSEKIPDRLLGALYTVIKGTEPPKNEDGTLDMPALRTDLSQTMGDSMPRYKQLSEGCIAWDEGHDAYIAGLNAYHEGLIQYETGLALFNEGERQLKEQSRLYEEGLAQYNEQKAQYDQAVSDLSDGKKQLEEGRRLLAEGEAAYENGLARYNEGTRQIDDAQADLTSMGACRWLFFDCRGNASFVQLSGASNNFSQLKMTFSLLFVLVGALVVFATVGKMVDEQRTQVGTTKALGFFTREIFLKYISFGVLATLIGTVLGVVAARFGVEPFMLSGFNTYYVFDMSGSRLELPPTLIAFLAAVLLAAAAVWFASSKLLKEPAVRLMVPKIPEVKKKTGGRSRLSLYSRLILLNMRTDVKRVAVTIASVAGCCALVVIGVSLRFSLTGSTEKQYAEIACYDLDVQYNPDRAEDTRETMKAVLQAAGAEFTEIFRSGFTYHIDNLQLGQLFCGDVKAIQSFYRLNDWKTGRPLYPTNEGVLIQRRMAESFGLDVDSELEIALGGVKTATVRVAGVFENYLGHNIVMSSGYYETLFGEAPRANAFMVRLNGADEEALCDSLRMIDGYESVARADADRSIIASSLSMINMVVVLFIFLAAIMAGVVQMNLTNMYMLQKKRELTIMRVNGFSVKEVILYMLRETFFTTAAGIVLGLAIGSGIAYRISRTLEQPFIQFDRSVCFTAWLCGAALTVVFTVIVNYIALRKVKDLRLTDVA